MAGTMHAEARNIAFQREYNDALLDITRSAVKLCEIFAFRVQLRYLIFTSSHLSLIPLSLFARET